MGEANLCPEVALLFQEKSVLSYCFGKYANQSQHLQETTKVKNAIWNIVLLLCELDIDIDFSKSLHKQISDTGLVPEKLSDRNTKISISKKFAAITKWKELLYDYEEIKTNFILGDLAALCELTKILESLISEGIRNSLTTLFKEAEECEQRYSSLLSQSDWGGPHH